MVQYNAEEDNERIRKAKESRLVKLIWLASGGFLSIFSTVLLGENAVDFYKDAYREWQKPTKAIEQSVANPEPPKNPLFEDSGTQNSGTQKGKQSPQKKGSKGSKKAQAPISSTTSHPTTNHPTTAPSPSTNHTTTQKPAPKSEPRTAEMDDITSIVLSYMAQPRFTSSNFTGQITGTSAELMMYDLTEGMVYFSIPVNKYNKQDLQRLSKNPSAIRWGQTQDGKYDGSVLLLEKYGFRKPGHYIFRFPSVDFRVNPSAQISVPYKSATYTFSLKELEDFAENRSIHGGSLRINLGKNGNGAIEIVHNHGAFVAKKGEPSLERLVTSLVPSPISNEHTAQRLLDFVTREVKYDQSEVTGGTEVLKRPNEVLMSRGSDCSGKVILYASLLEQAGVDYRLVYYDHHISVAVEWKYSSPNGLGLIIDNKLFSIAETTSETGFIIGGSRVKNIDLSSSNIQYIQKPGKDSKLQDFRTGKAVEFL
ncbi:transglutaminase domain-containing protein [Candidatus Woesearchaeota archaeon]|nr:transglutaminase domain-containing protein [Candidatus Woesearchaeota archaeon]